MLSSTSIRNLLPCRAKVLDPSNVMRLVAEKLKSEEFTTISRVMLLLEEYLHADMLSPEMYNSVFQARVDQLSEHRDKRVQIKATKLNVIISSIMNEHGKAREGTADYS